MPEHQSYRTNRVELTSAVQNLEDAIVADSASVNITASGDGTSSSIDLQGYSALGLTGASTETSNAIIVQASIDDSAFYRVGEAYPNLNTGEFYFAIDRPPFRYYRVTQSNSSAVAKTITLKVSKR